MKLDNNIMLSDKIESYKSTGKFVAVTPGELLGN